MVFAALCIGSAVDRFVQRVKNAHHDAVGVVVVIPVPRRLVDKTKPKRLGIVKVTV